MAILATAWRVHAVVKPYQLAIQNLVEHWLSGFDCTLVLLGTVYTALVAMPGVSPAGRIALEVVMTFLLSIHPSIYIHTNKKEAGLKKERDRQHRVQNSCQSHGVNARVSPRLFIHPSTVARPGHIHPMGTLFQCSIKPQHGCKVVFRGCHAAQRGPEHAPPVASS